MGGHRTISTLVALLRGINVGGHNRLPMATLRELVGSLGGRQVQTYIQSGNVVLSATPTVADGFADKLTTAIAERCGFRSEVIVRTRADLERIARTHPFADRGIPDKLLHIVFLRESPTAEKLQALQETVKDELLHHRGRELYIGYPNGSARSRVRFDRLGRGWTSRNVRSVRAILELAARRAV